MTFFKSHIFLTVFLLSLNGLDIFNDVNDKKLFCIERSRDANTVHYSVNLNADGTLNQDNPIAVFWLKPEKNNKKESLTWVQRKFGYGVEIKSTSKNEVTFVLVCQKDKLLTLKKDENQDYHVFAQLNNQEVILEKINIDFAEGGGFMTPKVNHITLYGINRVSHEKIEEVITP